MIYEEIDKKEESHNQYDLFVNLYIKLYYEPLVEEFDEFKYFTRDFDRKLTSIVSSAGQKDENGEFRSNISSISIL